MEVREIPRTGRPKVDEPRKKSVCIRLTEAEYDAVSQYAAERNWTITRVLVEGFDALQGKYQSIESADSEEETLSDVSLNINSASDIETATL